MENTEKNGRYSDQISSISWEELEKYDKQKEEVDSLSHFSMCYMWRMGTGNKDYFDSTKPISKYFKERLFNHFGGFTPEISKEIGW